MVQVYDFTNEWFDTITPSTEGTKVIIPSKQLVGLEYQEYRTQGDDIIFQFYREDEYEPAKTITLKNYLKEDYNVQLQIPGYKGELRNYISKIYNNTLGSNNGEFITAKRSKETILTLAGNDTIQAGTGTTMVVAGEGDDNIIAGTSKYSKGLYTFYNDFGTDTIEIKDVSNLNLITFYDESVITNNIFYNIAKIDNNELSFNINGLDIEVTVNNYQANGTIILKDVLRYKDGLDSVQFALDTDSARKYLETNLYYWTNTLDMISKANVGSGNKKDLLNCSISLKDLLQEQGVEVPQVFFDFANDWHETITTIEDATTLILPNNVLKNYELSFEFQANDLDLLFYAKKSDEVKKITIKDYLISNDKVQLEIGGKGVGELRPYLTKQFGVVFGSHNDDEIIATGKEAMIYGKNGNDTIYGSEKGINYFINGNDPNDGNDIIYGGTNKSAKNIYTYANAFDRDTIVAGSNNNFNLITFYDLSIDTGNLFDSLIPVTKEDLSFVVNGFDIEVTVNKNATIGTLVFKDVLKTQTGMDNIQFLLDRDNNGLYANFMDYVIANKYQNTYIEDIIAKANMDKGDKKDLAGCTLSLTELLREHPEIEIPNLSLGRATETKNQTIKDSSRNEIISGGFGNDKITYTSGLDTINAGYGSDTITVSKPVTDNYGFTSTEYAPIINTGTGKSDTVKIANDGAVKSITAGGDKTTISLGSNNMIDSIVFENGNSQNTITGKDLVSIGDIQLGNSKNTIKLGAEATVNITGVDGANTISIGKNSGSYVETMDESPVYGINISTGENIDKISIGDNVDGAVINAGNGNNTITIGKNSNHLNIYAGEGNDTIKIGDGYKPFVLNAGNGNNTITVGSNGKYSDYYYEEEYDFNEDADTDITTGDGNDKITVGANAKYVEIEAGNGENVINIGNNAERVEITTGNDADKITIGKTEFEARFYSLGAGNDTVTTNAYGNTFYFGKGYFGEDLYSSTSELYGDDVITIAKSSYSELHFDENTEFDYDTNKNDLIITSKIDGRKTGSVTLKDYLASTHHNAWIDIYSGSSYIAFPEYTIGNANEQNAQTLKSFVFNNVLNGGSGNDKITSGGLEDTINAGAGNDTITASARGNNEIHAGNGHDVIKLGVDTSNTIYAGDGNDTITTSLDSFSDIYLSGDYGNDVINLHKEAGTTLYFDEGTEIDYTIKGKDLIVTSTNNGKQTGTVTLKEYASSTYQHTSIGINVADTYIDLPKYEFGNSEETNGQKLKSTLFNNELNGGSGNDTITTGGLSNNIQAGNGNDKITTGGASDTIYAGDGDDTIKTGIHTSNEIYAEEGNDTIITSKDSANFMYFSGDYGNDTVTLTKNDEYNSFCFEDSTNFVFKKSANGNDLIICSSSDTHSGSVTIKNFLKGGYEDVYIYNNYEMFEELENMYNVVNYANKNPNEVSETVANIITGHKTQETIIGSNGTDVIYTAGSKVAFGGMGDDIIYAGSGSNYLQGADGADQYYADKAYGFNITKDSMIIENYNNGELDELMIEGQGNSEKLFVLFDVAKTGCGLSEFGNSLYIVTNPNHVETKGIEIENYFDSSRNIGFGSIKNSNDNKSFNTNVINEITIAVQSWLDDETKNIRGFENACQTFSYGNTTEINSLLECYKAAGSEVWVE